METVDSVLFQAVSARLRILKNNVATLIERKIEVQEWEQGITLSKIGLIQILLHQHSTTPADKQFTVPEGTIEHLINLSVEGIWQMKEPEIRTRFKELSQ